MSLVETDQKHGFSTELRVGMVRWMRRWLLEVDDVVTEPEFPIFTDEELQCSPGGQMLLVDGQRSVYDLNIEEEKRLAPLRKDRWAADSLDTRWKKIRAIANIRTWNDLPSPKAVSRGFIDRAGYRIEKLVLEAVPGRVLPCLAFVPENQKGPAYLYVHGKGKAADAGEGGPIEELCKSGSLVLAADLSGIGELAAETTGKRRFDENFGAHWKDFYIAALLGKSMVGIRAEEILLCAKHLQNRLASIPGSPIHLIATGDAVIPAMHAAALEGDRFVKTELREGPVRSWAELVAIRSPAHQLLNVVHGALRYYDLPDLN